MKYAWIFAVLCIAGSGLAVAEETYNRVSLGTEAARMVENDRMEIRFAAHAEDPDPLRVAEILNQAMEKALALITDRNGVDAGTGQYRIQPVYGKSTFGGARQIEHWQGYQQLTLSGTDRQQLRDLAAQAQRHLVIEGMGFSVSPDLRERTEDALLEPAIAKLREKATKVRKALGKSGYKWVHLNIGRNGAPPVNVMRAPVQATRALSAPAVAAGNSRVVMSVSAVIELY